MRSRRAHRNGIARSLRRWALTTALIATAVSATPAAANEEKRALPDYDGRADPGADAGDVLLWFPRIILSPAYFVSEFVLRRPLGYLITEMERTNFLDNFYFLGEGKNGGIFPTFLVDFGVESSVPSFGLYLFYNGLFVEGNDLRFRAAFGGEDWIQLRLTNRITFGDDDDQKISFNFGFDRRPDRIFAGIGGDFSEDDIARYGAQTVVGSVGYEGAIGSRGLLGIKGAVRHTSFFSDDDDCCDEQPSIQARIAEGHYPEPPRFGEGYTVYAMGATVALDSRPHRPANESGVRGEVHGEIAIQLDDAPGVGWAKYGAAVGAYWDFWHHRTLGLTLRADMIDAIDDAVIPFDALVMQGGDEPMSGFGSGRLRGKSAISAVLDYRWPVWTFLDGWLYAAVGNVFGDHLEGFEMDRLRISFGLGMKTANPSDHPFQFLVAAGTEPIKGGAEIQSVRFVIGTTNGF